MAGEKEIKQLLELMNATHQASEFPVLHGTVEQTGKLLNILGELKAREAVKGMTWDDLRDYFAADLPGRVLGGRDVAKQTPVGLVPQPAPLDITSCLYWTSIPVHIIEELYDLFKEMGSEPDTRKIQHDIETIRYKYELERLKDEFKPPEGPTGILNFFGKDGKLLYTIEQRRDPKNIPDWCYGGSADSGIIGKYLKSLNVTGDVDATYVVGKENLIEYNLKSQEQTNDAIIKLTNLAQELENRKKDKGRVS